MQVKMELFQEKVGISINYFYFTAFDMLLE